MPGPLRCQKKHVMLRVARSLWLCDKCRYATGDMQHLKGVVEESFAILERAGGIDKIRSDASAGRKLKRDADRQLKAVTKKTYDKYGYYEPILFEPPTRVAGEGDDAHAEGDGRDPDTAQDTT